MNDKVNVRANGRLDKRVIASRRWTSHAQSSPEFSEDQDDNCEATRWVRSFESTKNVDPQDDDWETSSLCEHHLLRLDEIAGAEPVEIHSTWER